MSHSTQNLLLSDPSPSTNSDFDRFWLITSRSQELYRRSSIIMNSISHRWSAYKYIYFYIGFEDHVNFVLTVCSQRIYLLKLLKSQGLPPKQLQTVFTALILARITYAISVWGDHLTGQQRHRINAFLKRAKSLSLLSQYIVLKSCWRSLILNCLGG